MVTLRQDTKGNFSARKRLPDDVRDEYGRRHGQRLETKFFALANTGSAEAKRLFREWRTRLMRVSRPSVRNAQAKASRSHRDKPALSPVSSMNGS
jgi:hypothetical protein